MVPSQTNPSESTIRDVEAPDQIDSVNTVSVVTTHRSVLAALQQNLQWCLQCGWCPYSNCEHNLVALIGFSIIAGIYAGAGACVAMVPAATGAALLGSDTNTAIQASAAGGSIFMLPLVMLLHINMPCMDDELETPDGIKARAAANFHLVLAYYLIASVLSSTIGGCMLRKESSDIGELAAGAIAGSAIYAVGMGFFAYLCKSKNDNNTTARNNSSFSVIGGAPNPSAS